MCHDIVVQERNFLYLVSAGILCSTKNMSNEHFGFVFCLLSSPFFLVTIFLIVTSYYLNPINF